MVAHLVEQETFNFWVVSSSLTRPIMTIEQVKNLHCGDEVWWTDPCGGKCSRSYKLTYIQIYDDIICIEDVDGSYLECYASELS